MSSTAKENSLDIQANKKGTWRLFLTCLRTFMLKIVVISL